MTDSVKEFIEENIDSIDAQYWDKVIESWYEMISSNFTCTNNEFDEFAKVLQTAGIDFMKVTETTRKEFMTNLIDQILHEELESMSFKGHDEIKKSDVLIYIDSNLGFTDEEVDKIMEDVAVNSYNLEPDFTCFYVR